MSKKKQSKKKVKKEFMSKVINVKMTPYDYNHAKMRAELYGHSLSEFIRILLREYRPKFAKPKYMTNTRGHEVLEYRIPGVTPNMDGIEHQKKKGKKKVKRKKKPIAHKKKGTLSRPRYENPNPFED